MTKTINNRVPWNKGIPMSEESKKKVSNSKKANPTKYWLGRKRDQETIEKISKSRKGKPAWNKGMRFPGYSGENHPNWKGGLTSKNKIERVRFKKNIQKKVFERDDYTCQLCGDMGVDLQVDHIQSWAEYVDLRFDMDNCRTVCSSCHYEITFGKPMPDSIRCWGHTSPAGG